MLGGLDYGVDGRSFNALYDIKDTSIPTGANERIPRF
jgi:hypothetical protein